MATEQALYDTAIAFISAFANLEANTHTALRTASCIHIFAPSSVNPPPPMTNEDFATHLTKLHKIATGFPVTAKEIHVNFPKRQVIIWASAVLNFREELKGLEEGNDGKEWDYVGEYMFLLDLHQSGKISRIVEFLDSLGTERARLLIAKAWKNAGLLNTSTNSFNMLMPGKRIGITHAAVSIGKFMENSENHRITAASALYLYSKCEISPRGVLPSICNKDAL